jgi:hypothetical protein
MKNERVIIVGGPRRGKSTLAKAFALTGYPVRCGDPLSKVKEPLAGVEYLPEGIPISGDDGAAQWVADNWFQERGPWVCEGWVMARALRRWLAGCDARGIPYRDLRTPADRIIVLDRPAFTEELRGQASMHKAVMTVWHGIAHHFTPITETIWP